MTDLTKPFLELADEAETIYQKSRWPENHSMGLKLASNIRTLVTMLEVAIRQRNDHIRDPMLYMSRGVMAEDEEITDLVKEIYK